MRTQHGFKSDREDSVARRDRRRTAKVQDLTRALNELQRSTKVRDKVPSSSATQRHDITHRRILLTSTQYEWLRRRVLYVVNGTWAREIDMSPETLRDALLVMCRTNFSPADKTRKMRAR